MSPDEKHVVKVCEVIRSNKCFTVRKVPDDGGFRKKQVTGF